MAEIDVAIITGELVLTITAENTAEKKIITQFGRFVKKITVKIQNNPSHTYPTLEIRRIL